MGISIKAAIVVGTAAAVYGVMKLRDASNKAAQALNNANAASAKASKTMNAQGVAAAKASMNAPFNTQGHQAAAAAKAAANTAKATATAARAARVSAAAAARAATPVNQTRAATGSFAKVRQAVTGGFGGYFSPDFTPGKSQFQADLKSASSTVNALSGVSKEARNWYKLLVDETKRGPGAGMKAIKTAARAITDSTRGASEGLSSLSAMFGGLIAAIGGTALLGGAGGLFERSFGLARAKEDARITFDTLLGSRVVTDQLLDGITKYAAQTPFQKADIVNSSKRLLTISGKDVKENERMYKLAGQIAALKPGTSVEEVSQGIISGAFGEFEILKGMSFVMRAEMFKGAGKSGGKQYGQAVIAELEKQLKEKTGGRDLVLALSTSLTGLMSTIKDSVEEPLTSIGESIISGIGIKQLMADYIVQATYFSEYFAQIMSGGPAVADSKMFSGVKVFADVISDTVKGVIFLGKEFVKFGKMAWAVYEGLGPGAQKTILSIGAIGAAISVAAGIIIPLIVGITALVSIIWAPLSAVGTALAGLSLKAMLLTTTLGSVGAMIVGGTLFSAFMIFRKQGESLGDTFSRLGHILLTTVVSAFNSLKTVAAAAWAPISLALYPAWVRLEQAFARVRPYFVDLITLMSGSSVQGSTLALIGQRIGDALVWILDGTVGLIEFGLSMLEKTLIFLRPHFSHFISDLKVVTETIFNFFAGTASLSTTMKTLFLGFIDVVTSPFRIIIEKMYTMTASALTGAANMVRPISDTIADLLDGAAAGAKVAADVVSQGFLKTRQDLLGVSSNMSVSVTGDIKASVPVQLNLDGQRVAESQAQVDMRARNSGRGGEPMNPEEMGFVINNGKIKPAGLSSVSAQG